MNLNDLPADVRETVMKQLGLDGKRKPKSVRGRKQRTPKPPPVLDETVLTLPTNWRELVALTMAAHKLTQIEVIEEADYLYVYYASVRTVDPRTVAEWFRDSGLPCYRVGMDGFRDEMYAVMRKAA